MPVDTSDTLIDVFVDGDELYTWHKTITGGNIFQRQDFRPIIYFHTFNEPFSRAVLNNQDLENTTKKELRRGKLNVLKITFNSVKDYKKNFRFIEKRLSKVGTFYNADIPVEEMFMFENDLYPLKKGNDDINNYDYQIPRLKTAKIRITDEAVELNGVDYEKSQFVDAFNSYDPDIIYMSGDERDLISIEGLRLNRFGENSFPEIKGNTYFSYGQSYYRETPIYLKGRILVNSSFFMTDDFNLISILEGSRICRMRIQRLASHSVGAAVTNLLTYQAYIDDYLIPYKVGVYERIKPFRELVECDRGAYTVEPYTGLHKGVVELDFFSMFPSIISKYNMSPETLGCRCCSAQKIPQTNYHFCQKEKGIVSKVCDYLMDRRMHFKGKKDIKSEYKTNYLKWLLVVIFGFQSFKNKKIGCIEVHESINAAARETLMMSIRIAEKRGFTVVHAIVDSLYVKKKNFSAEEIDQHDKLLFCCF